MNRKTLKCLLLTGLMLCAVSLDLKAQHEEGEATIQPRVGVTFSTLPGDDDAKMKVNLAYGVEGEYFLTDQFSLAGGVLFTNQGAKYSDGTDFVVNIYYTAIPITANYYVVPGLALKAGVQPAYRVKTKIKESGEQIDVDKALQLIYGNDVKLNNLDISFPVGLSYELHGVTLDARYNFGVTKLFSGLDDNVRNSVFTVTLGYKF
ncbi:MAG: porin family protein [Prevotella sp.]|nr:porin family protein [Prevotella sp.]